MEEQSQLDIYFALLAGTLLFTVFAGSVVCFFILYKKRLYKKQAEMSRMESKHKEDLLFSSIISAENERKRMSADIHDELGSIFASLSSSFVQLERSTGTTRVAIYDSKQLVQRGLDSVRRISHAIMPPELELYGLLFTLENLCVKLNATGAIDAAFDTNLEVFDQSPAIALALYRICQELSSNTLKHAGADTLSIQLNKNVHGYELTYTDNGKGFDITSVSPIKGLGLKNIESRVRMIKGTITYNSIPGNGFFCRITLSNNQ